MRCLQAELAVYHVNVVHLQIYIWCMWNCTCTEIRVHLSSACMSASDLQAKACWCLLKSHVQQEMRLLKQEGQDRRQECNPLAALDAIVRAMDAQMQYMQAGREVGAHQSGWII